MPTLNWIGKDAVIHHDKAVPFRLLKKVKGVSVGENSQNLIIHGDNLEALKALMPHYVGKIKCIYIDPPYNTGNEGWVYNDRVNSPKMVEWLGKVVGRESEDLTRHDKWLCMMYPRLKLLRDLLSDDGAIFISLDDNEHCHFKLLMDEIFGDENFVGSIIWQKRKGGGNDSRYIGVDHEFVVIYVKSIVKQNKPWRVAYDEKYLQRYKFSDDVGPFYWDTLSRPGLNNPIVYDVICPDGSVIKAGKWQISKGEFEIQLKNGDIKIEKNKKSDWSVLHKVHMPEGRVFRSVFSEFTNKDATDEMETIFENKKAFSNPKPMGLIKSLMKIITDKDSIILDSFAGSGTTGHAVLDLNKEDGGNRKFILVEMEKEIAKDITAERVKRAIKKYDYQDGFEYCELDKPLFNEYGKIEETCDFKQFAAYIYFTETQTNIDPKKIDGHFIGEQGTTEYYLLFAGKHKNELNKDFLDTIKNTENKKIVYADICLLDDETLVKFNVVFKQIPYEVRVY